MDKNSLFWRLMGGELPRPPCALMLGAKFKQIDPEAGTIETEFDGRPEFLNPIGHIQGGFLAAMLDSLLFTRSKPHDLVFRRTGKGYASYSLCPLRGSEPVDHIVLALGSQPVFDPACSDLFGCPLRADVVGRDHQNDAAE
jgi:hypothetical protein